MSTGKFDVNEFCLKGEGDDLRVDSLCRELLLDFYSHLLASNLITEKATQLAHSADIFVRDFLVDRLRTNPFDVDARKTKQFAATWYIIATLEPTIAELKMHLEGIVAFSTYLKENGYLTEDTLDLILHETSHHDYFADRIESYWNMAPDGYYTWEAQCSLKQAAEEIQL